MVMGLCGLALLWHRAAAMLGEFALRVSQGAGAVAGLVFVGLTIASSWRWLKHRDAMLEDSRHPVRHVFFAAIPVSIILLATVWVARFGAGPLVAAVWIVGCVLQLIATLWVMARWLDIAGAPTAIPAPTSAPAVAVPGLKWAGITPALFIPVVGNVVTVQAGVPLGFADWAAVQFGVGAFFWPVVMTLILVRIGSLGLWPERMLAVTFISVAPPALVGLGLLQLGTPAVFGWAAWGIAAFVLCWAASVLPRLWRQPFSIGFWALSFPLAAFSVLTLQLAGAVGSDGAGSGVMRVLGAGFLALTTGVILLLFLATVYGLFRGNLLVEEPKPGTPP